MSVIKEKERPLVSVGILTYNHEKYIAEAIESVLKQKVNFKYEIVIAEDCSTDNTRNIVIEYKKKYPDIIRLILQPHNMGIQENSNILRRACRGIYRANLEGDDYWAVDDKLQQQVDFLEMHPDFIAIGGEFKCIDDNGKPCKFPWGDIRYTYCQDNEYTKEHLKKWLLFGHTSTMLFRNLFYDCDDGVNDRFDNVQILGDRRISLFLVMQGRIRHEKKVLVIRRVLSKSKSSMTNAVKNSNYIGVNYGWLCEAERYAKSEFNYNLDLSDIKEKRWIGSWKFFIKNPSRENLKVIKYIFLRSNSKTKYIYLVLKKSINKIIRFVKENGFINFVKRGLKFFCKLAKENMTSKTKEDNSVLNSFSKNK